MLFIHVAMTGQPEKSNLARPKYGVKVYFIEADCNFEEKNINFIDLVTSLCF